MFGPGRLSEPSFVTNARRRRTVSIRGQPVRDPLARRKQRRSEVVHDGGHGLPQFLPPLDGFWIRAASLHFPPNLSQSQEQRIIEESFLPFSHGMHGKAKKQPRRQRRPHPASPMA